MIDNYESPFSLRWASDEMRYLFSREKKFRTWRRLWIVLAESLKELGVGISQDQIAQMKQYENDLNIEDAEEFERQTRHDVMSHILAYGKQCPLARPIIHLGATSCYVGDNTDILVMHEALLLLRAKLQRTMRNLKDFAIEYRDLPTLGFTHFQPAQVVTVGKRACLWLQDLLLDLDELEFTVSRLKLRGAKGTTGTQASYLELFNGDEASVVELDRLISEKLGFQETYDVTGQTYPRKVDSRILNLLSQIAQSAHKFATDIRLLQNLKEIEEPFEKTQVGSSAMAYKRNPMRSERICGLARFVINNSLNASVTASVQWLERTLDDSSNRRLSLAESFLATDSILNLYINITDGLVVYPGVIEKHLREELPFMATEAILMDLVKRGGDRQTAHEKIRIYSMQAAERVKVEGLENNLLELIASDPDFGLGLDELRKIAEPSGFIGRCRGQVDDFINDKVCPRIDEAGLSDISVDLKE
ncbi:MAG: adenylosuccinate lyase [Clostridia bacterium]|nr:adenylosuccinate lyase [Clostridia bacterium]